MRAGLGGIVCSILAGGVAGAQSYQGGVRGSITDAEGVVPGVDVTLTDQQTTISRSTATNEHGEYAFPAVEPGTYGLTSVSAVH